MLEGSTTKLPVAVRKVKGNLRFPLDKTYHGCPQNSEKNDYNLNISRYVSTSTAEKAVDLQLVNSELVSLEEQIVSATSKHNEFLKELGLPPLPLGWDKETGS